MTSRTVHRQLWTMPCPRCATTRIYRHLNLYRIKRRSGNTTIVYWQLGCAVQCGWKAPLALIDLGINSPYNTYQNFGLPPGPICSPALSALQAVAYPAQTPYYFFRARCDGSGLHNFSETFDEHVLNACP